MTQQQESNRFNPPETCTVINPCEKKYSASREVFSLYKLLRSAMTPILPLRIQRGFFAVSGKNTVIAFKV